MQVTLKCVLFYLEVHLPSWRCYLHLLLLVLTERIGNRYRWNHALNNFDVLLPSPSQFSFRLNGIYLLYHISLYNTPKLMANTTSNTCCTSPSSSSIKNILLQVLILLDSVKDCSCRCSDLLQWISFVHAYICKEKMIFKFIICN